MYASEPTRYTPVAPAAAATNGSAAKESKRKNRHKASQAIEMAEKVTSSIQ